MTLVYWMKIKTLPRHVRSIKLMRIKAPPVASPTSQCPTFSFTSILYNCILNENALRKQIIEWHMNLIISLESLGGIGSDKLFIPQVSKENLSLNLSLDSKRRAVQWWRPIFLFLVQEFILCYWITWTQCLWRCRQIDEATFCRFNYTLQWQLGFWRNHSPWFWGICCINMNEKKCEFVKLCPNAQFYGLTAGNMTGWPTTHPPQLKDSRGSMQRLRKFQRDAEAHSSFLLHSTMKSISNKTE